MVAGRAELAVGRVGSGGLTDGMRIRSRSVPTSVVVGRLPGAGGDRGGRERRGRATVSRRVGRPAR